MTKKYSQSQPNPTRPSTCGKYLYLDIGRGKEAIIDEDRWHAIAHLRWTAVSGGRTFYVKSGSWWLHQVILHKDDSIIDHINHDGLDNRAENLRACSHAENMRNQRVHIQSRSQLKGVMPSYRRWVARIFPNGKHIYLGSFGTPEEAALAYNRAAVHYYGPFANLNDVTQPSQVTEA